MSAFLGNQNGGRVQINDIQHMFKKLVAENRGNILKIIVILHILDNFRICCGTRFVFAEFRKLSSSQVVYINVIMFCK